MIRTQLYLPEGTYEFVKKEAQKRSISFAAYTRFVLDQEKAKSNKKMTIQERYPFIGMFKGGKNDSDNEAIDRFILDQV